MVFADVRNEDDIGLDVGFIDETRCVSANALIFEDCCIYVPELPEFPLVFVETNQLRPFDFVTLPVVYRDRFVPGDF